MGKRGPKPGTVRKPPNSGRQKGTLNKVTSDVREAARVYGPMAIERLVHLMEVRDDSPAVQLGAAKEILDRAYGKAPQSLTGENGEGPVEFLVGWLSDRS